MMKTLLILLTAVCSMSLYSCNKTYDCTCIDNLGEESNKTGKGNDADEACNNAENKVYGTSIEECTPSS